MELWALQVIADGTVSLAELEQQDPILGRNFKDFVTTINRCCPHAYEQFSTGLQEVLALPSEPSETMKAAVVQKLSHASDDVARTCNDLVALANTYDADLRKHAGEPQAPGSEKRHSLTMLLTVLHKYERYLKQDIQYAVDVLKMDIANSRIAEARQRALTVKDQIDRNLTRINGVAVQIAGSAADGVERG